MAFSALIFLDFDGVVHSLNSGAPTRWEDAIIRSDFFDDDKVQMLLALCREFDARIVVSSAWRLDFSVQQFNEVFEGAVIDITPHTEFDFNGSLTLKEVYHQSRYKEVMHYLKANKVDNVPWVVFDDQPKHFPTGLDNVFITNAQIGLTQDITDKARSWLASR